MHKEGRAGLYISSSIALQLAESRHGLSLSLELTNLAGELDWPSSLSVFLSSTFLTEPSPRNVFIGTG